jgi:hypothetical protein
VWVLEELELEEVVVVGARVLDRGTWEPWMEEGGAAGAMAFELGAGEAVLGEAGTGVPDGAGVTGAGEPGAGVVGAGEPVGVTYGE